MHFAKYFKYSGHYDRAMYHVGGLSGPLLLPLLDNQLGEKNLNNKIKKEEESNMMIPRMTTTKSKDEVLSIVKDLFITAAERDIFTGDGAYINIITLGGIEEQFFDLRQD